MYWFASYNKWLLITAVCLNVVCGRLKTTTTLDKVAGTKFLDANTSVYKFSKSIRFFYSTLIMSLFIQSVINPTMASINCSQIRREMTWF